MPDPGLGQFAGKLAHLKRQEQPLFSRHRLQNLLLNSLRRGACIGEGHGQNVTTLSSCGEVAALQKTEPNDVVLTTQRPPTFSGRTSPV